MSNVPNRNTEFIDNPIGKDRPIYGNEVLPQGGCLPEGITPVLILTDNDTGDSGVFYPMTEYSGGSLTSVYITAGFNSGAFRDHDNFVINTPLNGVNYSVWQGNGIYSGGYQYLIYDNATGSEGYRYFTTSESGTNTNPIYGGDYLGGLFVGAREDLSDPIVIGDNGYPPLDMHDTGSFQGRYTIVYSGQSCNQITPTPTISQGYLPPTPSSTPQSSPPPTPTPTPTFVCSCYSFSVVNNDEGQITLDYIDCDYTSVSTTIDSGSGLSFCACLGSVSTSGGRDVVITNYGTCSPPEPTSPATSSPPPL